MNNKHLSTYKQIDKLEINQKLIDEVLNMEDVYIKNEEGLKIKASNHTFVSGQFFYLLAEGSNGEKLVFLNSKACAAITVELVPTLLAPELVVN